MVEVHIGCVTANIPLMGPLFSRLGHVIGRFHLVKHRRLSSGAGSTKSASKQSKNTKKSQMNFERGFQRMEEEPDESELEEGTMTARIGKGETGSADELERAGLGATGILVRKDVEQQCYFKPQPRSSINDGTLPVMATTSKSSTGTSPPNLHPEALNPPVDFSHFHLLDDVFRVRATDPVQVPLLAFPKSQAADFEYFTGKDLDRFTDEAAWYYSKADLDTTLSPTVALLGPTNLDWVVSTFALSRAGYTILTLSPRLSYEAMVKLMQETECQSLVYFPSAQLRPVVNQVASAMAAAMIPMLSRYEYDLGGLTVCPFIRKFDVTEEKQRYAAITVFFLNPNLPVTCEGITAAIREAKPSALGAVPYTLKLLSEQKCGIDALRTCEQVVSTGSQCPDDLGDLLVEQGVNLATFMGATECGYTGASFGRLPEDKAWNYIRVPPPLMKHIWPKPITEDAFEFVYLKDYPTRTVSNSGDPPDSFHSEDLFMPHQAIPLAWKFLGRLDDRITLINGEKVLPLPIEGRIRRLSLVQEAVVFGIGRAIPGLLLFRAEAAGGLSDSAFISHVWPEIEASNKLAEGFSHIGRDMVVVLPSGIEIPTTDKGSIIRAQLYKTFQREIDDAYAGLEGQFEGEWKPSLPDLEEYLMKFAQQVVGPQLSHPSDDLFSMGMNSLQAIQMRGRIIRDLDLGGNSKKFGQDIVFEQGNLENLTKYLHNLRLNIDPGREKPVEAMRNLISKFSIAQKLRRRPCRAPSRHVVVLTGATGGLGAHVLAQLLELLNVDKVYCLVRGPNASSRLERALGARHLVPKDKTKLAVLTSDLSAPKLGLIDSSYMSLLSETTHVIHCAWPVTFQLALSAFQSSLQGLQNLLQLSLDVKFAAPARFLFCSSISTALGNSPSDPIPEAPVEDLERASLTGYAQSKLVSEHIVQAAVHEAGANASILRIGQIVGDTMSGWWNDSEAIPLIIRSALTMGTLPKLDLTCEWLPVDTLARSIIQIGGLETDGESLMDHIPDTDGPGLNTSGNGELMSPHQARLVYNLVSPHTFSWTDDLLPALSSAGLSFRPTSFATWIHRLRSFSLPESNSSVDSSKETRSNAAADPNQNPAIKLVDFFEGSFQTDNAVGGAGIIFDTKEAQSAAPALRQAPMIIESGLLAKMVEAWMRKWKAEQG
ncbi:MAG: hypothetical protein Q9216_002804 [Gyalolechia sp. 2 TL-2023]